MSNLKKVLITGFEPFRGESLNPSKILLEKLQQDSAFSELADFVLLPVSFQNAGPRLEKILLDNAYAWVIHLGQAGGRDTVSIEQVALNWMGSLQDESGYVPDETPIDPGKPAAYISHLPLRKIATELKEQGLPVSLSQSAGVFLCNYVYFKSCVALAEKNQNARALFIHVPYLPEQVVDKPDKPSLAYEVIEQSVSSIIQRLLELN